MTTQIYVHWMFYLHQIFEFFKLKLKANIIYILKGTSTH